MPPGQAIRLRGEDLMEDPELYLRQICQWLGISEDAAAIDAMKRPEESPFACLGPPNAMFGNNADFLRNPGLRIGRPSTPAISTALPWLADEGYFGRQTIELARQLGYR
jgi:hypothetical protein